MLGSHPVLFTGAMHCLSSPETLSVRSWQLSREGRACPGVLFKESQQRCSILWEVQIREGFVDAEPYPLWVLTCLLSFRQAVLEVLPSLPSLFLLPPWDSCAPSIIINWRKWWQRQYAYLFLRIGFSWAPKVVQHKESQWDSELLTPPRVSLGHCSACRIWQIQTLHRSSLLGGGLAANASSKNKTCWERRARLGWGGHWEARVCCPFLSPPLPVSHCSLLLWTSGWIFNRLTSDRQKKDKDHFSLRLLWGDQSVFLTLNEKSEDLKKNALRGTVSRFIDAQNTRGLGIYYLCTSLAAPAYIPAVIICDAFLFTD